MKHDWKYIKLGDIISPAKVVRNGANKKFPVLSITMRDGIVLQSSRFKKSIASVDTSDYKVVYNGQLVIAFPIDEGLIYTQDIVDAGIMSPAYNVWNVDFLEIDRKFLVLYLHCPFSMAYYKSKLRGTTMRRRSMPKEDLLNMPLPVPSFSVQQSIVSELDKINELIRLKKEQLNDYDKLSQSIFYEMFGDPVVNEKGWEVKKFANLYKLKSGDNLSAKNFVEGEIPVYGGNGISGYHNDFNMDGDFIIIGRVGVYCGNVREVHGKFWLTDNAFQLFYNREIQNPCFIHYLLDILDLHKYANAAAQPVISNLTLKDVEIIIPPLALQKLFAQRIELIEQQKAEIQSTIADLETLLASRIQYWFD